MVFYNVTNLGFGNPRFFRYGESTVVKILTHLGVKSINFESTLYGEDRSKDNVHIVQNFLFE